MKKDFKNLLMGASAFAALCGMPHPALAESAAATGDAATSQEAAPAEITVTARRRDESIVDVPLAISVVTSDKLEKLSIKDTTDLSKYVPGLEFNSYTAGNQRNDRGANRSLTFRGLALGYDNIASPGSLFLDGAAVIGNEVPAGMDIGQVEVLRGPQSVYFGRSSMTGAVSYRTKAIPDHLSAEFELSYAQRNAVDLEASVAGPVIPGLLGVRLSGLYQKTDGYVTNDYNNGSGRLGDQSRKSVSATIALTPAPNLDFKGYVNYFRDEDGASATAFVPASLDNCTFPGATFSTFCGEVPNYKNSINYISTTIPAIVANDIFSSPLTKGYGFRKQVGGQRAAFNSHLVGNWEISDYLKLQEITAYHTNVTEAVADGIGQPPKPTFPYSQYFYNLIGRTKDFSQEVRISSDPARRFSWTAGANYIDAYSKTQAIVGFIPQVGNYFAFNQGIARQGARTYGIFGGGYFKLTDRLTLSAEGRYQWDKRSLYQVDGTGAVTFNDSQLYKSFSPRVSADYDVGGGRKIYASYSTGNRPGGFNAAIKNYVNNAAALSQIQLLLGSTEVAYKEEQLKIGEIGFKGSFGGGKGFFDLNGYYGKLSNQQVTNGALIPALGFTVSQTSNIGQTEIYGLEYQGNYSFTRDFSLATTFSWNHSVRTKYLNNAGVAEFGTTNFDGKKFSNVPEFTGSAVLSYSHPISGEWNGFSNLAYTYRGKQFLDAYNAAYIKGRSQLDVRAGVSNSAYTIELFVKNLFDDRNYTGGSVAPDFGSLSYYAFFGAVAEPRQFGGRIRAKF